MKRDKERRSLRCRAQGSCECELIRHSEVKVRLTRRPARRKVLLGSKEKGFRPPHLCRTVRRFFAHRFNPFLAFFLVSCMINCFVNFNHLGLRQVNHQNLTIERREASGIYHARSAFSGIYIDDYKDLNSYD